MNPDVRAFVLVHSLGIKKQTFLFFNKGCHLHIFKLTPPPSPVLVIKNKHTRGREIPQQLLQRIVCNFFVFHDMENEK